MSSEFILLLVCLGAGVLLSVFLLIKTIVEVRKMRKNQFEE